MSSSIISIEILESVLLKPCKFIQYFNLSIFESICFEFSYMYGTINLCVLCVIEKAKTLSFCSQYLLKIIEILIIL